MSTYRKTEIKFFDVMDYEKEADYLSKMHSKGWKFVHVGFPGVYHFVKCEPDAVRYQLDYNQDGVQNKEEYIQMFADMGWEYLFDFVGYSYFRKPVEEGADEMDEEIFCDDDSRWEMMKRIFRGRILPMILIFIAMLLPTFVTFLGNVEARTVSPRYIVGLTMVLFFLYVWIFVRFAVKYFAFKKKLGK